MQTLNEKLAEMRRELEDVLSMGRINWLCSHCGEPFDYATAGVFELRYLLDESEHWKLYDKK